MSNDSFQKSAESLARYAHDLLKHADITNPTNDEAMAAGLIQFSLATSAPYNHNETQLLLKCMELLTNWQENLTETFENNN